MLQKARGGSAVECRTRDLETRVRNPLQLFLSWGIFGSLQFTIYIIYNRLPVLQMSMFRSSSQYLVGASGQRRPAKPSGALCSMQSTTTCCTDCVMCPQAHVADSWTPQSFNMSPTRAVPQRMRFSFTHCLRWRSAQEVAHV